jgi:hypothetical protein
VTKELGWDLGCSAGGGGDARDGEAEQSGHVARSSLMWRRREERFCTHK